MRLFIAIEIPDAWRVAAEVASAELANRSELELRISAPGNAHLTVRFLGDIDEDDLPVLVAELQQVRASPCELRLSAAGTFGPAARTRVVWLGIEGKRSCLDGLTDAVNRALIAAGMAVDSQQWRPHLTIARVRDRATAEERRGLARLVQTLPVPEGEPFTTDTVSLYQSHLGDGAPRYELLTAVRIG